MTLVVGRGSGYPLVGVDGTTRSFACGFRMTDESGQNLKPGDWGTRSFDFAQDDMREWAVRGDADMATTPCR
jgi:hypothetical protein